jgi:2-dehydro-3-deoxyphosphogalactonate aldolase
VANAGGQIIVSPNTDIGRHPRHQRPLGLQSWPGVMTPTECFAALARRGGRAQDLPRPSSSAPKASSAIRAVLPPAHAGLHAVGGAGPDSFADWIKASASGFGIGSALFKPGMTTAEDIATRARDIVAAYDRDHSMTPYDDTNCLLGEGPLWHPERDELFWFDILGAAS